VPVLLPARERQRTEPVSLDSLKPGDSIGAYKILADLGEGGMGKVYRAEAADGTVVALKLVKAEFARDQVFRKRFDREAAAAQRVKHPNVVAVLDTGEQEGIPYLAAQFYSGGTLLDRIEKEGSLPLDDAVKMCLEVAGGLDALHEHGLVHRDVKPANILLDDEGTAHITDFGLAKDRDASVLTKAGQALGSMDYMAPEQIRGEEVSAPSDVYALGCVMVETLTGKPPFSHREGMRILWAHLQEDPPDPSEKRPDLPPDVGYAVLRALEKEIDKRPPTASAYARMLQLAATGPTSGGGA
jgi:serine/threonine-protein kinase